jgi:hypothetical protein
MSSPANGRRSNGHTAPRGEKGRRFELGPISYLDCLAFCWYLAPALLRQVGWLWVLWTVFRAVPFCT